MSLAKKVVVGKIIKLELNDERIKELAGLAQLDLELQSIKVEEFTYDIVGIKGHGVVAIDTSPWRSYEDIERLEHICKIVLTLGKY
jgi:ribulose-5-phosphate 4-epimerase/fuculose-1-phosphate aldolase